MTAKTTSAIENPKLALLVTIEAEGERAYLTPRFDARDWLASWTDERLTDCLEVAGCKWDRNRQQWAVGAAALDRVETTIRDLACEVEWKKDSMIRSITEKAKLGALLRGLVSSSVGPRGRAGGERNGASDDSGDCSFESDPAFRRSEEHDGDSLQWTYYRGTTPDGQPVVKEEYRCSGKLVHLNYHAPEPIACQWALSYAAAAGITVDDARRELAKNAAIEPDYEWYGSDLYWAVVVEHEAKQCPALRPETQQIIRDTITCKDGRPKG